jgi:prepilin-type processing-associated H-X9-DG protein
MDRRDLYAQYRFDEPWNGPHNRQLADQMPDLLRCPSDKGPKVDTSYFVVVGPKTFFPGATPLRIRDVTDGTTRTILVVESADSEVNWMEPRDSTYEDALRGINAKPGLTISSRHPKGAYALFADGHVQFLADDTPQERLQRLLERNDGQPVSGLQD